MIAIAMLGWFALGLQLSLTLKLSLANGQTLVHGVVTFFSYFTILTNLLAASVLTFALLAPSFRLSELCSRPMVQTGTAVYIAVVGVAYSLLLRHIWDPQGLQRLADILLHDAIPLLFVMYWVVFVSNNALRWSDAFRWLGFCFAYFVYSTVRGAFTAWYAYPFLDANEVGYARMFVNAILLLGAFLIVGLLAVAFTRWRTVRAGSAAAAQG